MLGLHQEDVDRALALEARTPREAPKQASSFSFWRLLVAAPRGVGAGALELGASALDVSGGLAENLEALPEIGVSPFAVARGSASGEDMGRASENARRLLDRRERERFDETLFRTEAGATLRDVAKDLMPDAVTSHRADQVVADLFRLGTKAVGAGVALGPVGGAIVAGSEEGFTVSDELARKGVDLATRSKVGAATAAVTAGGFALPVAGRTIPQTVGLALAGGPASFMAEQYASREILRRADYSKLADRYNPLDPVGLALSTLLPLGFGAAAMRGAARSRAHPDPQAAAADAAGASDAAPPALPERTPIAQGIDQMFDGATVDAARVNLLSEHVNAQRLTPADDFAGAAAHEAAMARAIDQLAAGERVDVGDIARVNEGRLRQAMEALRERTINLARGVTESVLEAASRVREFVRGPAVDALDNRSTINFAQVSEAAQQRILRETGVDVAVGARQELRADAVRHAQKRHPDLTADDWEVLPWVAENFDRAVRLKSEKSDQGQRIALTATDPATGYAYVAEYRAGKKKGDRLSLVTFFRDHPGAIDSYLQTNGRGPDGGGSTPDAPLRPRTAGALTSETGSGGYGTVPDGGRAGGESVTDGGNAAAAGGDIGARADKSGRGSSEPAGPDSAARDLEAAQPDLLVRMDGMDEAVPLSELMALVRQEAAQDLAEAPLVQTAVNCALRTTGAGG